jgi:hypothetical protein
VQQTWRIIKGHTNPVADHDTSADRELLKRDERTSDLSRSQFSVVTVIMVSCMTASEELSRLTEEQSWTGYRHRDQ